MEIEEQDAVTDSCSTPTLAVSQQTIRRNSIAKVKMQYSLSRKMFLTLKKSIKL